jgi:hypothetical protein
VVLSGTKAKDQPRTGSGSAKKPKPVREINAEHNLSLRDFAIVWEESDTIEQFASATGIPIDEANHRASMYRQSGVQLKKMPRRKSQRRKEIEDINKMIAQIREKRRKEGKESPPPVLTAPPKVTVPHVQPASVAETIKGLLPGPPPQSP